MSQKTNVSLKEIIESVDQLACWSNLIGVSKLGVRFNSPFRVDKRPDCKLVLKGDGKVRFIDPARKISWDLLDAYKEKFPAKSIEDFINDLKEWSGSGPSTAMLARNGYLRQPRFVLEPMVVEWSEWGIDYWARRGVTIKQLSNPKCLTQEVCGYQLSGENDTGEFHQFQYVQGFVYWCNGKPKCYFPGAPKEKKFRGNFNENDVWLVDRSKRREKLGVPDQKMLLIAKGNKDFFVWSSLVNCDLMNLSAERVFPTDDFLFKNVRLKYEKVLIVLDPDPTGVAGGEELKRKLLSLSDIGGFQVVSWPFPDREAKDLDKYRETHGEIETKKFLMRSGFGKLFQ